MEPEKILANLTAKVEGLANTVEAQSKQISELTKTDESGRNKGPFARKGESILSSRGFQFSRVIGVMAGKMDPENAKVERELCDRLNKEYVNSGHFTKHDNKSVVVPLSTALMGKGNEGMEQFAEEIAEVVKAGVLGADLDEMRHFYAKTYGRVNKTLSWQSESALGALVGPPVFGEPIELLRNQEVFMKAGAKVLPFPPSGRITFPRFTGSTTGYWVGSGANDRSITASEPTTGDVVLQVKKLGVYVSVPNELFRFPTVSVEQILRQDMMKTAALKMDKAFLEGVGSATQPKGIINYDNINAYTASTVGTDGNTFEPEDVLRMIGTVEEQNVDFGSWIMRPLMYSAIGNRRADATSPGDKKGMFLFNVLREMQAATNTPTNNVVGQLEGYPVFKSNQVGKDRTKGASSTLSYILGGNFEQYMIALSGVMEMLITNVGDTNFQNDQSTIRLITWCDGAPRHEEAFILCDSLVVA